MKLNSSRFLHNKQAFSLLELLLVLMILSILALSFFPNRPQLKERFCIQTLNQKLQLFNQKLSLHYQSHITHQTPILPEKLLESLVQKENPNCYFFYKNQTLYAWIEGQKLTLNVIPKDWSYKPKISCSLSNALCRKFLGKTAKK